MKTTELIEAMQLQDAAIAKVQLELKKLNAARDSLELRLLAKLKKMNMESVKSGKITAAKRASEFLRIADRPKFLKYVIKNQAYDLFQNRVSPVAVRERAEHGEKVPGLKTFTKHWIQLKKGK